MERVDYLVMEGMGAAKAVLRVTAVIVIAVAVSGLVLDFLLFIPNGSFQVHLASVITACTGVAALTYGICVLVAVGPMSRFFARSLQAARSRRAVRAT